MFPPQVNGRQFAENKTPTMQPLYGTHWTCPKHGFFAVGCSSNQTRRVLPEGTLTPFKDNGCLPRVVCLGSTGILLRGFRKGDSSKHGLACYVLIWSVAGDSSRNKPQASIFRLQSRLKPVDVPRDPSWSRSSGVTRPVC